MTRDQMIAWLTLEGYESHCCEEYGDVFPSAADSLTGPGIWRYPDMYAYVLAGSSVIVNDSCMEPDMRRARKCPTSLDRLSDNHLKLLYDAAVKYNGDEP
jgi:hypothetical protein